jgi:hypothetical protein
MDLEPCTKFHGSGSLTRMSSNHYQFPQIHTSVCGNPRDGYSILGNLHSKRRGLPQSATHI